MKHLNKGIATLIAVLFLSFSSIAQCERLDTLKGYKNIVDLYLQEMGIEYVMDDKSPCRLIIMRKIVVPSWDLFSPEVSAFAHENDLTLELIEYRDKALQLRYVWQKENEIRLQKIVEFQRLLLDQVSNGSIKSKCIFILEIEISKETSLFELEQIKKEYFDCQKE